VSEDINRRIQPEPTKAEYRSATTNAILGLMAFGAVTPLAAPYVHKGIGKLTGPKDDGPRFFIQPGTVSPPTDE
jgi:hypothetical protein